MKMNLLCMYFSLSFLFLLLYLLLNENNHNNNCSFSKSKSKTSKSQGNIENNSVGNYMEGYLTKKSGSSGHIFSDPWVRCYYVLHNSDLYYYKSKEDYDLDPKKTIKSRPVNISQYFLKYGNFVLIHHLNMKHG